MSQDAQRLLDDPVLQGAFSAVLHEAMADWLATPESAVQSREDLYRLTVAVSRVQAKLLSMVNGELKARVDEAAARVERI